MENQSDSDDHRAVFKKQVTDLAKFDRTWTPAKASAVAIKMIVATNADNHEAPSQLLADIAVLAFGPSRETRLRLLKKYAAAEGFVLDSTTEELLNEMADQQAFAAQLAKVKDPETGEPLITRKTKRAPNSGIGGLFV